ncbi:penicillin-binding protein 1C [Aliiroseovarius sp. YM-037]|uniref:penicillin-binding protein 1C n=1 Tax=Aliiroseovarius sp. YM-037 TaxID=3341728 RepID=UPI003A802CFE
MKRRALFLLAVALWGVGLAGDALDRWVAATVLPPLIVETSAEVRARDGTLLRAYTVADGRWRMATTLAGTDRRYIDMLLAYEDKRFYDHNGVDILAMIRAVGQAAWNGEVVSGGSTLTMQVARMLEDSGTGRWEGKIRQIRVALALERRLSKDQILEFYLNRAPFGGNLEGVRSATRAYFGKDPRRLTPAEAALLVALPQSPETRRPDRFPERAEEARRRVLARTTRAHVLSPDMAAVARRAPIPTARARFPMRAPHLADRALADDPTATIHDLTIDAGLQGALESLAADAARSSGNRLSIAILVADHQTGEILASVGSAAYRGDRRDGFVDMTRALRSPGSTLKPLIYGMAFEEGLAHPETLIEDRPTAFGTYVPQNFDGQFRGTVRASDALQQSLNIPVIALTDALGPTALLNRMRRAGMEPVVPGGRPGLAIALGGIGVTLEDLVTLYAGIGHGGQQQTLQWRVGVTSENPPRAVLSAEAAWQVGHILSGLAPPPNAPLNRLAYKTGTSYGHRDAWAIGFDGRHVVGVWMGRPDGTPVPGAFGGDLAAPVLFDAFARLKSALDPLPAPPPATLLVSTADLPPPLQRFRPRGAVFERQIDGPDIAFPPDGAVIAADGSLTVKVRNGTAPFTWLVNGAPVVIATREFQSNIGAVGPGFLRLSVIDATGRASRVNVSLE